MRNAESFIVSTINSVLKEKRIAIEVIVVNDKSTDRSLEKLLSVSDERIRIVDGPGAGISACLNAGFAAGTGDIVMRCDADDHYPEHRIHDQVAWLDANPAYAAVCGSFSTMDSSGHLVAKMPTGNQKEDITQELNSGKTRTHFCTFAIRREAFHQVAGFRQYFETSEDIDLQLRLGEAINVMYLPESMYFYRIHNNSITHTQGNSRRLFYEDTARLFQVQRKASGKDDLQRGDPPKPPVADYDAPGNITQQLQGILIGTAWHEHVEGNRLKAIGLGFRALRHSPLNITLWKSFLALIVKPRKKTCKAKRNKCETYN